MKVGILSDTHLDHRRFAEDAVEQMKDAVEKLSECDIIIHAGDMFDVPSPSYLSLKQAYEILSPLSDKVFAISGNHEKRPKDLVDPVQFLSSMGAFSYVHNNCALIGDVAVLGMSYVHDQNAKDALMYVMENNREKLERE